MQASLHWWKKNRFSCAWLEGNVTHTLTLCYAMLWLNRRKSIVAESFAAKNKSGSTKQLNANKKTKALRVGYIRSQRRQRRRQRKRWRRRRRRQTQMRSNVAWKNWFEIIDKWKTKCHLHSQWFRPPLHLDFMRDRAIHSYARHVSVYWFYCINNIEFVLEMLLPAEPFSNNFVLIPFNWIINDCNHRQYWLYIALSMCNKFIDFYCNVIVNVQEETNANANDSLIIS